MIRIKRFWRDIDPKGSGGIVFEQFLRWWTLNFYDKAGLAGSGLGTAENQMPFETFYRKVRWRPPPTSGTAGSPSPESSPGIRVHAPEEIRETQKIIGQFNSKGWRKKRGKVSIRHLLLVLSG